MSERHTMVGTAWACSGLLRGFEYKRKVNKPVVHTSHLYPQERFVTFA